MFTPRPTACAHRATRRVWARPRIIGRVEPNDRELLHAWHNGDKRAGGQLFNRHFRAIHRFFASKVGPAYAEELSQQTFVAVVESA